MSKADYEVGYGKPPKHSQFKSRAPDDPPKKRGDRKEAHINVLEELNRPFRIARNGRTVWVYPHEMMIRSLLKRAANGEVRAINLLLAECAEAEMLGLPAKAATHGVFNVPHDRPYQLNGMLFERFGRPPWSAKAIADCTREYLETRTELDALLDKLAGYDL